MEASAAATHPSPICELEEAQGEEDLSGDKSRKGRRPAPCRDGGGDPLPQEAHVEVQKISNSSGKVLVLNPLHA